MESIQTTQPQEQDVNLQNYFRILFWNKWVVLMILAVAILASLLKNDITSPLYEAKGKIWVQEIHQQAMPFMSGLAIPGLGRAVQLKTFSEIISTRTIISSAVQELRAEGLLEPLPIHRGKITTWVANFLGFQLSAETEQGELTIEEWEEDMTKDLITNGLKVEPSRNSDIITIRVKQPTPERARNFVNKIAGVFQRFIRKDMQRRLEATEQFADQQLPHTQAELEFAEDQLSKFQVENKTINLDAEAAMIIQNVGQLDLQRVQLIQKHEGARARLATLTEELSTVNQKIISAETLTDNPIVVVLEQQLLEDQIQLATLKRQYPGYQNPQIKNLNTRIFQTKKEISLEDRRRVTSQTTTLNPLHQGLTQQVIEVLAEIRQTSNQRQVLDEEIASYDRLIEEWPRKKLELARLQRKMALNQELFSTLESARQEARIVSVAELGTVKILEEANLPKIPISPRRTLNLALGVSVGLAIGVGIAFMRDYLDNTFPTLEEALHQLEALPNPPSFLGVVPFIENDPENRVALITHDAPKSGISEAFRIIRTKLQFMNPDTPMRTILITSATAGEGKSTISSNFVVALSQMNKKVLLVDADMRRPSQHKTFTSAQLASISPQLLSDTINESRTNVPVEISSSELRKPGLSELLVKMTDEDPYEALHSVIKKTEIENLDLITSGTIPPNPVELLNSEVMSKFLEIAQEEYDYVVVDSPPIHAVADPIILSTMVDTTILVFNIVKTGRFDIIGGAEILSETAPKNVALLCNMTNPQHGGYYGYGRYSYNKYGFYGGYGFYGRYRYGGNYYHYYSSEDDDDDDSNGKKRK